MQSFECGVRHRDYKRIIISMVFALFSKTKMAQYKGAAREGQRAAHLMKKREKQKEELELLKKKISDVCC